MRTIVFEKTFVFNELNFFTELLDKEENVTEEAKKEILDSMKLESQDFSFKFLKDDQGHWFRHCYKGEERITWDDIAAWMRSHVWDFEREHRIYFC